MSQYPPPPQGPGYPPPNFPPGTPPFGPPGYSLPPQSRLSGLAVTSLVCGLLICIPFATGFVALVTGLIALAVTGNPTVRGRGLAIVGLVLGLLSLVCWSGAFYEGYTVLQRSTPQRLFAQSYMTDLANGRIDKCVQNSTSNVTKDQLNADYKQMQSWGTFQGTMVVPQSWNYMNENGTVKLAGACVYSGGGQHRFTMTLSETGGSRKVDSYQWLP
jgi:hypothetical protein